MASTALCGAIGTRAADAACATDFCWNVPSGIWSVGGNWTPSGGPPTSTSTVTINNGGTATVDSTNAQSSNATIDSNSAVVVLSGGIWTNAGSSPGFNEEGGAIIVGETGTGGILTIDNGGTVTTSGANGAHDGTILIGDQTGSSGTITLGNGGTGTALLTSTAVDGSNFYVGYGGSGTLNIDAGGSVSGFDGMNLGVLAGGSGTVTVNAGSLAAGGVMTVGDAGTGTLTIENGATVTATSAYIASGAGANGSIATVTGANSTWTLTGDLTVGSNGNGSLTIANGGTVNVDGQLYLGDGTGGGTVTVNGGTLNGGEALIGTVGSGTSSLLIENGGVVSTPGPTFIGPDAFSSATSIGSVTVTGAGSSWSIGSGPSDYLEIENLGTVTGLTVENGASLTTDETLIGGYVSSAGNNAVVVSGAGTTWQSGVIVLGNVLNAGAGSGTGTLSISAGAQVSAGGNVDIGYSPDGGSGNTDTITVDGSGSKLTTTGNVRVGYYGTGLLTISNGGEVSDVEGDIAYSSTNSTAAATQFSGGSTTPTNSIGSVTVTGAGSLWQNTTLIVGDNTTAPGTGYGTGTSTGTLTISNGGEVTSTNAIEVGANAGATGTINIGAAVGQAAATPGTISAPAIDFGAGGGTIVFNHTSDAYVFAIPIEGGGSVDVESGTTELTAANSYTGATTINGGTLEVDGTIATSSGVTVNSGGSLTGIGTVAATTIDNGGRLAPGNSSNPTGMLTVGGSLVLQSAANYMVAIDGANASNTNVTGGSATLGGSSVEIAAGSRIMTRTRYTILTDNGGGLGGANIFNPTVSYGAFSGTLSYAADDVYLTFVATDLVGVLPPGAPTNVINVANALDNFSNNGGTLPIQFSNVFNLSGAQLQNALMQLDGEDATGAQTGTFTLMNEFLDLMLGQGLAGGGNGATGGLGFAPGEQADALPSDIALAYDSILKAPPKQTFDQRWSVWGAGFGGTGITNGNAAVGSNNVTTSTYGSAAGMEYRADPNTVYGFALAGSGLNWGLAQGLGTGRSDAFQAGVYGKSTLGPVYLSGAFAFGNNWFTTDRAALGDQLTATFTGQSYAARFESGYRFGMPAQGAVIGVTPYAALQTQWFHTPSYTETDLTGGALGLAYGANTGNDTRSEFGARFDDLTTINNTPLILRTRLAWAHDWTSGTSLDAAFESLPGSSFTVNGAAIAQNSALTSASAQYFFTPNWSFLAKFDGEFAPTSQTYAGSGTLKYTW